MRPLMVSVLGIAAAFKDLGDDPDRHTVSDLIWTTVMLPEFQLIR